jgi:hypothetical protein
VHLGRKLLVIRRKHRARRDRLAAIDHVMGRLRQAARESTVAQSRVHGRYQQELLAKTQKEQQLRAQAAQQGWTPGT